MSTCVLIVGAPRTGSSVVAGTLSRMGVFCGDTLMPADEWNPLGHYSDEDFTALFLDWLGEFGMPSNLTPEIPSDIAGRLDSLCESRRKHDHWCVKWYQAPYLYQPLVERGFTVKVIHCIRDRQRSIDSLKARVVDSHEVKSTLEKWVDDATEAAMALVALVPDSSMTVDFDSAIDNPKKITEDLAAFIGIPLVSGAEDWITPTLRRF